MASEIQYFNRSSTSQATFYVLLFQGENVANGGLTNINFEWTDTTVRNNAIAMSDNGHVGIYLADMVESVPAGRYVPVVFQASGTPSSAATTTDAFIERLEPINWDGAEVSDASDISIQQVLKIVQAKN